VFAFQGDGTVAAITSDGLTAWTASSGVTWSDNCAAPPAGPDNGTCGVPDFQGGLVVATWGSPGSIVKLDGMTGQPYPAYVPESDSQLDGFIAVHAGGTVFTTQTTTPQGDSMNAYESVLGLDPATGAPKFAIALSPGQVVLGLIIASDGYAYLPYSYCGCSVYSQCPQQVVTHLAVMRVGADGSYDQMPVTASIAVESWMKRREFSVEQITSADHRLRRCSCGRVSPLVAADRRHEFFDRFLLRPEVP